VIWSRSPRNCHEGIKLVGVKRHPPTFSRFSACGSGQDDDRLAGGSLRCLLTATAEELVGRSLAASTVKLAKLSPPVQQLDDATPHHQKTHLDDNFLWQPIDIDQSNTIIKNSRPEKHNS